MDYEEFEKSDNSLDTLLEEVRSFAPSSDGDKPAKSEEKTHKNWSLDDIDRLIADTIGENPAARAVCANEGKLMVCPSSLQRSFLPSR